MEGLLQEFRHGLRLLARSPGFTAVAVLTLALGLGATISVFELINTVTLRPLPYSEPDQLFTLWESQDGTDRESLAPAEFAYWRARSKSLEKMAAYTYWLPSLTGVERPEALLAARVSAELFHLLDVEPFLGRVFSSEEDDPGGERVAVLGHGVWQRAFGSDRKVVGRQVRLGGEKYTIIGVMPSGFQFPLQEELPGQRVGLWVPLRLDSEELNNRADHYLDVVARLASGISPERADAEMRELSQRFEGEHPDPQSHHPMVLVPLQERLVGHLRPAFQILLGAVACVLLVACANVVNLLLVRVVGREKEIAIRAAVGATRLRLARSFVIESLLLATLGGVSGLLLAHWGLSLFVALNPASIPRIREISVDIRVLAFTLAISVLAGLVSGLTVVLTGGKPNLQESLKEGGFTTWGRGIAGKGIRSLLVVAEVALAVLLTVGAALLIQSYIRLQAVDPGFTTDNVLTCWIFHSDAKYQDPHRVVAFYRELLPRLESLPGVRSAGAVNSLPLTDSNLISGIELEGAQGRDGSNRSVAAFRVVSPDYFETLRIPLVRGRYFSAGDDSRNPEVVIINQAMARRLWPGQDPLGKRLKLDAANPAWRQIVGVVGSVHFAGPSREPGAEVYVPQAQNPLQQVSLVVRTAGDPKDLIRAVRSEVLAIDRDQPIFDVRTMKELMAGSLAEPRFRTALVTLFSVLAFFLAILGIYGVLSYSVGQRTHEIGVRVALGAGAPEVLRMILGQGMRLTLVGVLLGLAGAFALTRVLSSLLFGVAAGDLATFAGVSLSVIAAAVVACFIPARRATRVDPLLALRSDV